jgi:hypothetical protein
VSASPRPHAAPADSEPRGASRRSAWAIPLAAFGIGVLLLFSRRPDALLSPQFQFEDGVQWYAQAHEEGALRALVRPFYRGYFVTAQRLAGLAAQAVPLAAAPFVMNLLAILVGALPAAVIASRRFSNVLPDRAARLLAAFLYLGQPGVWTTMANMAHAQWPLALLAGLLVVSSPPATAAGRAFDVAACALSGLSGPTAILLVPVAAIAWRTRRTRWSGTLAAVVTATALIQAACLAISAGEPGERPVLGASVRSALTLFERRIVLAPFVGDAGNSWLLAHAAPVVGSPVFVGAASLAGAVAIAWLTARSRPELRLLLLYGLLILAFALVRPPAANRSAWGYWDALSIPGAGNRYFVLPIFALLAMLAGAAFARAGPSRVAARVALAAVLAFGVRLDWREPAPRDYGFARDVERFERASPGERVQFVTPPGWSFVLTRR